LCRSLASCRAENTDNLDGSTGISIYVFTIVARKI